MTDREGPNPLATLVVGTIICPGVPEHEHKIYQSELLPEYQGTTASIQSLVDERNDWRKRALEAEALVKANEDRDLTSEIVELVVACRDIDKNMLFTPNRHLAQVQLRFKKALAAFAVSDEAEQDAKEDC